MATKSSGITTVALVLVGVVALSGVMLAVAMLGQQGCGEDAALPMGPVNATAREEIPAKLLPIFQQVGGQQRVYWQASKEECTFGNDGDPSCTIRWHGAGLGPANGSGAAGSPGPVRYALWGAAMLIDLVIPTRAWAVLHGPRSSSRTSPSDSARFSSSRSANPSWPR